MLKYKERKYEEKRREEILTALPSFINQLLLLLSSGMVLQEALIKIAINYRNIPKERSNNFTMEYIRIYEDSQETGENLLKGFCRLGRESKVKEFSRVTRILTDGEQRGLDLWDKLADEGEELWAERKRIALEKIRLSESKMSFPLGLILMALILITAAPAMLQMYIN